MIQAPMLNTYMLSCCCVSPPLVIFPRAAPEILLVPECLFIFKNVHLIVILRCRGEALNLKNNVTILTFYVAFHSASRFHSI